MQEPATERDGPRRCVTGCLAGLTGIGAHRLDRDDHQMEINCGTASFSQGRVAPSASVTKRRARSVAQIGASHHGGAARSQGSRTLQARAPVAHRGGTGNGHGQSGTARPLFG